MFYLVLAILGSASLPVLFRAFDDWRVNVFWAIPVNYLTCVLVGTIWGGHNLDLWALPRQSWVLLALLQGIILAVNFFLIAHISQRVGVSIAALASRLSVAIPALLAFLLYGDSVTLLKVLGLLGALLSLYLCIAPDVRNAAKVSFSIKLLPVLVFLTFGFYFTILKFAQAYYLDSSSYHPYVMSGFLFAFLSSLLIGLGKRVLSAADFRLRHLAGGLLLGMINYAAVYALLRVLGQEGWESSKVYPIYSVGVVALSTVLALILFREHLSSKKTLGLLIGLLAIAMLNR